ncbi:metacaspase-3 [Hevea brasiliensis]|uniref:metacaspase-3 n=1 Tax=Hevea brasiliensis TaxID=3981 RepID=UPI0025D01FE1|nr:metacaspase-3 [Hevea brasiliensis]
MIETRIIKCRSCHQRTWVATTAETYQCIGCKSVRSLLGEEQSSRVFPSRGRRAKSNNNISRATANLKEEILPGSLASSERPTRKRALLCGVSYKKKYKLKGTVNDVKNMRDLLITDFRFPEECIRQLTGAKSNIFFYLLRIPDDELNYEETNPELKPTRKNIEKALQWLVEGCRSGDSLVFYFAGHGAQENDNDRDEIDGLDETICPTDFQVKGMIVDDYINSVIVRPLVAGVTLHAIVDACHSATMLDLPYVCNAKEKRWVDNNPPSADYKGTSGGLAICISACRDDQEVVDSSTLCGRATLTHNLIQEMKKNPRLTYGALITSVQNKIDNAIEARGIKTWFLRKLFRTSFSQEVQISSSAKFDIYQKQFKL